jgi:preprotein translocase subunit YajC
MVGQEMALRLQNAATDLLMFAQADGGGAGAVPANGAAGPSVNPLVQMAPMLAMFAVLFYFIMIRPQQREQKDRKQKLDALKKNDKVLTIGGIIGTIVDLSGDGKRVTLRVDDGTRIKFTRGSIQGLYDDSDGDRAE